MEERGRKRKKTRIYNSLIKIALINGYETWRVKEYLNREIEETGLNALDEQLQQVRNEDTKERICVKKSITDCVEEKQLI